MKNQLRTFFLTKAAEREVNFFLFIIVCVWSIYFIYIVVCDIYHELQVVWWVSVGMWVPENIHSVNYLKHVSLGTLLQAQFGSAIIPHICMTVQ